MNKPEEPIERLTRMPLLASAVPECDEDQPITDHTMKAFRCFH